MQIKLGNLAPKTIEKQYNFIRLDLLILIIEWKV
jgi:hypothetical protein